VCQITPCVFNTRSHTAPAPIGPIPLRSVRIRIDAWCAERALWGNARRRPELHSRTLHDGLREWHLFPDCRADGKANSYECDRTHWRPGKLDKHSVSKERRFATDLRFESRQAGQLLQP